MRQRLRLEHVARFIDPDVTPDGQELGAAREWPWQITKSVGAYSNFFVVVHVPVVCLVGTGMGGALGPEINSLGTA